MLRIGICDDEIGARDALRLAVQRILRWDDRELLFYEFSSGEGALNWLKKHDGELDLLFLDIEMGGASGMETARRLRAWNDALLLVFVTGFSDYVFDGYSVGALDYLVKPVQPDKLEAVLHRALGALHRQAPKIYTVRNQEGLYRIPLEQIFYFYSDRRLVVLVSGEREYPFYGKLDRVQEELGEGFVRIHQRYLVRVGAVERVEDSRVLLECAVLPISRACRPQAMLALARSLLGEGEAGD